MNIKDDYKDFISQCEQLDYSNTQKIFDYALKDLYKLSSELCLIVMVNAIIQAEECLDETIPERLYTIASYGGNISSYIYIKSKLMENVNKPNFYHKDVLEEVLEIVERKYEKMKVNLKNYEINTQL